MSEVLPPGWAWARPDDVAADTPNALTIGPFGSDLKVQDYRDQGVPLIFVREIRSGQFGDARTKYLDKGKAAALARHYVRPGDLLVTKMGDPPGDTAVYPDERPPGIITADCIKLTPHPALTTAGFLRDCFRAETVKSQILEQTAGVAQQKLSLERFRDVRLPLPPLNEQRRIVDKLEALQARSRRAREALDAVPPLLEKLRQSILAAAFRGDLTKGWRAQNPNTEPASALLARIRTERRKKWEEAELAKLKAKGKPPTDDRWKAKYKEPEPVDTTGLPELPEGWCWAGAEELCHDITVGHVGPMEHRYVAGAGIPFLRSQNVRANRYDPTGLRFIPRDFHSELQKSQLVPGDLVIVRSGAPGTACVIPEELPEANCADLVIARLVPAVDPQLMAFYMNSSWARAAVLDAQVGVAQQHFNIGSMRTLHMPVLPRREQAVLLARIDAALTVIRAKEQAVVDIRTALQGLNNALLAKAFRGELVPQDPNDEPAEVTLSRLRADSAFEPPRPRGRRSKAAE